MDILILFVQHGNKKYPNSLANFQTFMQAKLPKCNYKILVIDNSITYEFYECIDDIYYMNGDNSCWEFSAWDKAIKQLGNECFKYDMICFATSALFELDLTYLETITMQQLERASLAMAICGKIYTTPELLKINNTFFNRWMRTSLFFIPPSVLFSFGALTTFDNIDHLFTKNFEKPFADNEFINAELKQKILLWLTHSESSYHSKFEQTSETFEFFKTKTRAILNEFALTLRIFTSNIPFIDWTYVSYQNEPQTLHIISPVNNFAYYDNNIRNNSKLHDEQIKLVPIDNTIENKGISYIYNQFINSFILQARGWLCFCHQDLKFLENPLEYCKNLDKKALYGVFGGRLVKNADNNYVQEYVGKILQPNIDGTSLELLGMDFPNHTEVDALDCVMLIVHSDIFLEHNLRFDENLDFHQYVDELCLQAKTLFNIPSKVINLSCLHDKNAKLSINSDFCKAVAYVTQKYTNIKAAGNCAVYGCGEDFLQCACVTRKAETSLSANYNQSNRFTVADTHVPVVLAAKMISNNCRILDVGCSCGDCGFFLKQTLNATLWGFEYDIDSIQIAQQKTVYEDVFAVDLNKLIVHSFPQFLKFFDVIFCGDVLEHLNNPLDALVKLQHFIKNTGHIIVSLPNIMHIDVVLGLLGGNFYRTEFGILDKTHLQFFTWKSLAQLFTDAGFMVTDANVTFSPPEQIGACALPKTLDEGVYKTFIENIHFFVVQYICKLEPSNANKEELFTHNLQKLFASVFNNQKLFLQQRDNILAVAEYAQYRFDAGVYCEIFKQAQNTDELCNKILESGLFNSNWYLVNYPCAEYAGKHPLLHYLERGWLLGWNPSEIFDTLWYQQEYLKDEEKTHCPLLHYVKYGIFNNYSLSQQAKDEQSQEFYIPSKDDLCERSLFYLPITESPIFEEVDTRLIAFYLPQYYPFELNNTYWGEGFTDWRNVAKAKPQFEGHYQPHIPIDLGFYDLRLEENAFRQFELAKLYGIHGFCYYHYWFDGKRLMDMPIYRHLNNKHYKFPFCLCWAPETWRTTWNDSESVVMLEQPHDINAQRFFEDILPFIKDERYIRVNGKPLIMIYHPTFFSKPIFLQFLEKMRYLSQLSGIGDLHIVLAKSYVDQANYTTPQDLGGDAFADFPPHGTTYPLDKKVTFFDTTRTECHQIFDMRTVVEQMKLRPHFDYIHYPTVFPMWDNTARSVRSRVWTFLHSSPQLYGEWLKDSILYVSAYSSEKKIVFINAWNEWAEGAHLEPDLRYGYAYLNATRQALEKSQSNNSNC